MHYARTEKTECTRKKDSTVSHFEVLYTGIVLGLHKLNIGTENVRQINAESYSLAKMFNALVFLNDTYFNVCTQ